MFIRSTLIILIIQFLSYSCIADLSEITELELSDITGQAFINIDTSSSADASVDFTKLSFGLDVATSLNADLIELGKYDRDGEVAGSADIRITDFALGEIDQSGNIIPFEISDPFVELAYEKAGGVQNLVGVRIGFGGALGKLSGKIESLTGNIEVGILGDGQQLYDAEDAGPIQDTALWFAGVRGGELVSASAELVDPDTGEYDPIRATAVGMLNGNGIHCEERDCFLLDLDFAKSSQCGMLGIPTCFPITNFKSLDIGNNGQKSEGLFLSFQTKEVAWIDGNTSTPALEGAFMNIPNGGIIVDFEEAFNGTPRARTRYVDPYFGGF